MYRVFKGYLLCPLEMILYLPIDGDWLKTVTAKFSLSMTFKVQFSLIATCSIHHEEQRFQGNNFETRSYRRLFVRKHGQCFEIL